MSASRPLQELLARLVDEAAIESEPIEEVRADLAPFGIDPAGSIRMARRLAAGAASPAGKLLGRIAESESLDDELRHLEQADIAKVRGQLPSGDAAAAIAHAHRASGRDSKVVGLRRRRSRRLTYGLSGLAAALAASLVFYVGLSQHRQDFSRVESGAAAPAPPTDKVARTPPAPATNAPDATLRKTENFEEPSQPGPVASAPAAVADAETTAPASPPTLASDDLQARLAPAASAPEPLADQPATDTETSEAKISEIASGTAPEGEATGGAKSLEQSAAVQAGDRERAEAPEMDQQLVLGGAVDAQRDELRGDMSANVIAPPFGIEQPVLALLVVDPKLLPAGYRQEQFSTGALAARLTDARRQAAGRRIVALVTLRYAEGVRDALVMQGIGPDSSEKTNGLAVTSQKAAQESSGYQVELLDRR